MCVYSYFKTLAAESEKKPATTSILYVYGHVSIHVYIYCR